MLTTSPDLSVGTVSKGNSCFPTVNRAVFIPFGGIDSVAALKELISSARRFSGKATPRVLFVGGGIKEGVVADAKFAFVDTKYGADLCILRLCEIKNPGRLSRVGEDVVAPKFIARPYLPEGSSPDIVFYRRRAFAAIVGGMKAIGAADLLDNPQAREILYARQVCRLGLNESQLHEADYRKAEHTIELATINALLRRKGLKDVNRLFGAQYTKIAGLIDAMVQRLGKEKDRDLVYRQRLLHNEFVKANAKPFAEINSVIPAENLPRFYLAVYERLLAQGYQIANLTVHSERWALVCRDGRHSSQVDQHASDWAFDVLSRKYDPSRTITESLLHWKGPGRTRVGNLIEVAG